MKLLEKQKVIEYITENDLLKEFHKMKLLGGSHKTELSNANKDTHTFYTVSLNLAPADMVQRIVLLGHKVINFTACGIAKRAGCAKPCIGEHSGMNVVPANQRSKIIKTLVYIYFRSIFDAKLRAELDTYVAYCTLEGYIPTVRLNCYSDLNWTTIIALYPEIQFYDYSKQYIRAINLQNTHKNYYVTLSYYHNFKTGKNNLVDCIEYLRLGGTVSFIYIGDMPTELDNMMGFKIVDGDKDDLIFTRPAGTLQALKFKGTNAAKQAFLEGSN